MLYPLRSVVISGHAKVAFVFTDWMRGLCRYPIPPPLNALWSVGVERHNLGGALARYDASISSSSSVPSSMTCSGSMMRASAL